MVPRAEVCDCALSRMASLCHLGRRSQALQSFTPTVPDDFTRSQTHPRGLAIKSVLFLLLVLSVQDDYECPQELSISDGGRDST